MKFSKHTLGVLTAFAVSLAAFTGTAMADNGGGNGNGGAPPGQAKKADQAPATSPAAQPPAKPSTSAPGVKPSSTTAKAGKGTHCSTGGGTGTSATCTGNGAKPDSSKQYGNGKTAAQIANSRGAPAGTVLTGPGNSQPHKVTACSKKSNRSGGVDVHAVKSYSSASCNQQKVSQGQQTQMTSNCTLSTAFAPSNASCRAAQYAGTIAGTIAGTTGDATTAATDATAPAATNPAGQPPAAPVGGVAGGKTTLTPPVTKSAGGVLGAVARLGRAGAGATLPFTGFALWIAVLAALGLIAGGFAVRSVRPSVS